MNPRALSIARVDLVAALVLSAATVAYVTSQPHNLGIVDESLFLYEAKRLAEGDVMYRDVFNLITPLSLYATALAFRLFGTDMSVARATIAVVHAIIVLTVYACCRRVAVRAALAAAVALAYLPLAQIAWPFVSPHWYATMTTMLVLLSLLSCRWYDRPHWMTLPGALTGLLIGVQQQKGVPIAAGVCALLVAMLIINRRQSGAGARLTRQLAYFAAGGALVVVPLFAVLAARAGIEVLFHSLIVFPLVNYRNRYSTTWGGTPFMTMHYATLTFPLLLKLAPLVLVPGVVRVLRSVWNASDAERTRQLLTLLIFAGASIVSILYYPDVIHLAFIAPAFLVVAAEAIDSALRLAPRGRVAAIAGGAIALVLAGGCIWRLHGNLRHLRAQFPISYETAFGHMDFPDRSLIPVIEKARELLEAAPVKEMFCYPSASGPYLWLDGRNPTRYQFFSPGYNDRQQTDEIIATLEARRTPLVLTLPMMPQKGDPIVEYVWSKYDYVGLGFVPKMFLYSRKPEPATR